MHPFVSGYEFLPILIRHGAENSWIKTLGIKFARLDDRDDRFFGLEAISIRIDFGGAADQFFARSLFHFLTMHNA